LTSTVCSGSSFVHTSDCGTTTGAVGTKNCVASLSLDFSNINYQWIAPNHYFYHTRTFTESNGVGVTLTEFESCFQSGGCSSISVNRRIEPNGQLLLNGQSVYTSFASEQFTLTYTGTDDNGNPISIQRVVSVSGTTWISP